MPLYDYKRDRWVTIAKPYQVRWPERGEIYLKSLSNRNFSIDDTTATFQQLILKYTKFSPKEVHGFMIDPIEGRLVDDNGVCSQDSRFRGARKATVCTECGKPLNKTHYGWPRVEMCAPCGKQSWEEDKAWKPSPEYQRHLAVESARLPAMLEYFLQCRGRA